MPLPQHAILFEKRAGETPLQALERLRNERPELAAERLTYAGRLDPLADGKLLVLIGEECKNRAAYLGLDKTYELTVAFGTSTDTHDVLGLVTAVSTERIVPEDAEKAALSLRGEFDQKYPMYSSKTLLGKPLFMHAREGTVIPDTDVPHKRVQVYDIHVLDHGILGMKEFERIIKEKVNSVSGDFRQAVILKRWSEFFREAPAHDFQTMRLRIHCSSGTYMRSLAHEIGKKLGVPALALHIRRVSIDI